MIIIRTCCSICGYVIKTFITVIQSDKNIFHNVTTSTQTHSDSETPSKPKRSIEERESENPREICKRAHLFKDTLHINLAQINLLA